MADKDFKDKLVSINRITKVVKGGRRFAFAALVVVGNQSGTMGTGHAKAKQVPDAIKKATETAKRNLFKKAAAKKINSVYFDRGKYRYHGRIKILAETLRSEGMKL